MRQQAPLPPNQANGAGEADTLSFDFQLTPDHQRRLLPNQAPTYPLRWRDEHQDSPPCNGSAPFLDDVASSKKEFWGLRSDDFRLPEAGYTP